MAEAYGEGAGRRAASACRVGRAFAVGDNVAEAGARVGRETGDAILGCIRGGCGVGDKVRAGWTRDRGRHPRLYTGRVREGVVHGRRRGVAWRVCGVWGQCPSLGIR